MDKYDCYGTNDHDLKIIANEFIESGNILFTISSTKSGWYRISLNDKFDQLGIMPFGGNPNGKIWVSVMATGCNHLDRRDAHADYIAEKIRCTKDCADIIVLIFDTIQMLLQDRKE